MPMKRASVALEEPLCRGSVSSRIRSGASVFKLFLVLIAGGLAVFLSPRVLSAQRPRVVEEPALPSVRSLEPWPRWAFPSAQRPAPQIMQPAEVWERLRPVFGSRGAQYELPLGVADPIATAPADSEPTAVHPAAAAAIRAASEPPTFKVDRKKAQQTFPDRVSKTLTGFLGPGDLAIDATAETGEGAMLFAELVGPEGRVVAIDPRDKAIKKMTKRFNMSDVLDRVNIIQDDYDIGLRALCDEEAGRATTISFRLGYEPNKANNIPTQRTLQALNYSATMLRPGGVLFVSDYPSRSAAQARWYDHGLAEGAAVGKWMAAKAREGWKVDSYSRKQRARPDDVQWVAWRPLKSE